MTKIGYDVCIHSIPRFILVLLSIAVLAKLRFVVGYASAVIVLAVVIHGYVLQRAEYMSLCSIINKRETLLHRFLHGHIATYAECRRIILTEIRSVLCVIVIGLVATTYLDADMGFGNLVGWVVAFMYLLIHWHIRNLELHDSVITQHASVLDLHGDAQGETDDSSME